MKVPLKKRASFFFFDSRDLPFTPALALGKIQSEKAVEPLINLLKNENKKVRRAAVRSLGKIPSEKAIEPLIEALKDEDDEVRLLAIEALENIGTPEALMAVVKYNNHN